MRHRVASNVMAPLEFRLVWMKRAATGAQPLLQMGAPEFLVLGGAMPGTRLRNWRSPTRDKRGATGYAMADRRALGGQSERNGPLPGERPALFLKELVPNRRTPATSTIPKHCHGGGVCDDGVCGVCDPPQRSCWWLL
jgi:hypothetical protein